ncbi:MAG: hypothetical protein HRU09_15360 [Oligoflexales bacterium]|nr:hypothetical protein [Oligoflexales bacterium]
MLVYKSILILIVVINLTISCARKRTGPHQEDTPQQLDRSYENQAASTGGIQPRVDYNQVKVFYIIGETAGELNLTVGAQAARAFTRSLGGTAADFV